jgi:DNA-binding transcriptional LysR family regulator
VTLRRVSAQSRGRGGGRASLLDAALAAYGGPTARLLELASTTAVKATAISEAGPAVLSGPAVAEELAAGRLTAVPVVGLLLARALRAVWPSSHRPAGPDRDLLSLTRCPRG